MKNKNVVSDYEFYNKIYNPSEDDINEYCKKRARELMNIYFKYINKWLIKDIENLKYAYRMAEDEIGKMIAEEINNIKIR